jgi:hypothetical protein
MINNDEAVISDHFPEKIIFGALAWNNDQFSDFTR